MTLWTCQLLSIVTYWNLSSLAHLLNQELLRAKFLKIYR